MIEYSNTERNEEPYMNKTLYNEINNYMLKYAKDSAHDPQHIYRVLYTALDIAKYYEVNYDVLISAVLLHDIGRFAEYQDPRNNHAIVGGDMAYKFMIEQGFSEEASEHIRQSIYTHRYNKNNPPRSIEAKILFDSDKLDIAGAIGIVRTLQYGGTLAEPLYRVDEKGNVISGDMDGGTTSFSLMVGKLMNVSDKLYTDRAKVICTDKYNVCRSIYESIYNEVKDIHEQGVKILDDIIE